LAYGLPLRSTKSSDSRAAKFAAKLDRSVGPTNAYPDLEALGIRMLLNESVAIDRGRASIYLAGVDDAHFYRADNIEKAAADIPHGSVAVPLSHTPEIYRQAAHAGFDLMLGGHTHRGQICLPRGIPILLEADLPRAFGAGAWRHADMAGYTSVGTGSSVVPVRFNTAGDHPAPTCARRTSVGAIP
jgi:predicted MPP superfamily phosphohydrolase